VDYEIGLVAIDVSPMLATLVIACIATPRTVSMQLIVFFCKEMGKALDILVGRLA
jgi:hypothetical protein